MDSTLHDEERTRESANQEFGLGIFTRNRDRSDNLADRKTKRVTGLTEREIKGFGKVYARKRERKLSSIIDASSDDPSSHLVTGPKRREIDAFSKVYVRKRKLSSMIDAMPPIRSIDMLQGCRSINEFEKLIKISQGTYGIVYKSRDKKSGEIVALKKVRMKRGTMEGFPIIALREINILMSCHHPSIVDVKEVVMGHNLDCVYVVMEYMEYDLWRLMQMTKRRFRECEVKFLMLQLLKGVNYLHANWVIHRDMKLSNILVNNRGELKICDLGFARRYGSLLNPYTDLVVTLAYRAPELLLGAKKYSTAIDMWSVGCIMAQLLAKEPLFSGRNEIDQLNQIFRILGTPDENIWPGFSKLPGVKVKFGSRQRNKLWKKFLPTPICGRPTLSEPGFDLLSKLLTYDPEKRITAEDALKHDWFCEDPLPKLKEDLPIFSPQNS